MMRFHVERYDELQRMRLQTRSLCSCLMVRLTFRTASPLIDLHWVHVHLSRPPLPNRQKAPTSVETITIVMMNGEAHYEAHVHLSVICGWSQVCVCMLSCVSLLATLLLSPVVLDLKKTATVLMIIGPNFCFK